MSVGCLVERNGSDVCAGATEYILNATVPASRAETILNLFDGEYLDGLFRRLALYNDISMYEFNMLCSYSVVLIC